MRVKALSLFRASKLFNTTCYHSPIHTYTYTAELTTLSNTCPLVMFLYKLLNFTALVCLLFWDYTDISRCPNEYICCQSDFQWHEPARVYSTLHRTFGKPENGWKETSLKELRYLALESWTKSSDLRTTDKGWKKGWADKNPRNNQNKAIQQLDWCLRKCRHLVNKHVLKLEKQWTDSGRWEAL